MVKLLRHRNKSVVEPLDITICLNTECWVNTALYEAEKANFCWKLCTKYSKVQNILTNIKLVMGCEMMGNNPQGTKSCIPHYRTHERIVLCSGQVGRNFLSVFSCLEKYKIPSMDNV